MKEKETPTAETGQETEKQNPLKETAKEHSAINDLEVDAEETGRSRQRFFSQTEVNRIVKREIERAVKSARLPELETAQAKVAELETTLKQKELRDQVTDAATKAGARNATLVFRAVEEKIELDEKGQPKNLDEVMKDARRNYPELFRRDTNGNANGGAGRQNQPQLSMNELLRKSRQ